MDVLQLRQMQPAMSRTTWQSRPSGVAGAIAAPVAMEPMPAPLPSQTVTPARTKGPGFFGTLKRPDGKVSTELSIGVNLNGVETEIPTLVPTLNQLEIDHLISGGEPTAAIVDKAVAHARQRIAEGKDPFAGAGEQSQPPGATANPESQQTLVDFIRSLMGARP